MEGYWADPGGILRGCWDNPGGILGGSWGGSWGHPGEILGCFLRSTKKLESAPPLTPPPPPPGVRFRMAINKKLNPL